MAADVMELVSVAIRSRVELGTMPEATRALIRDSLVSHSSADFRRPTQSGHADEATLPAILKSVPSFTE